MTPEEKARWDNMLAFRDEQQEFVTLLATGYRRTEEQDVEQRARRLGEWRSAQKLYDRMNDRLPPRYQKRLVDRCYDRDLAPRLDDPDIAST